MTYGYRLNIEDIFLDAADRSWEQAIREMANVRDEDPASAEPIIYRAPDTELGLKSAVQAVVGWAICLEAFVNLAWMESIATQMPSPNLNKIAMRQLSTPEKIKEILRSSQARLDDKSWLTNIVRLFELRNRLVHYKEAVKYIGHGFAPPYVQDFREDRMSIYRVALREAVLAVGAVVAVRTEFIDGVSKVEHLEE